MRILVALATAVTITAVACSSPAPTAPSLLAAAQPEHGFSAPMSLRPDASVCETFAGAARGICHGLVQTGCIDSSSPAASCGRLYDGLSAATGKTYIANPVQCAVIRYSCNPGSVPFSDALGCGCEPIP